MQTQDDAKIRVEVEQSYDFGKWGFVHLLVDYSTTKTASKSLLAFQGYLGATGLCEVPWRGISA